MIEELRCKIREVLKHIERINSLDYLINDLKKDIANLENREQELWNILQKENKDVKRLETMSATSIFNNIMGKTEERIDKEQAEAYQAKLNYDAIVNKLEESKARLKQYQQEKESLLLYQKQYQELFQQLRNELKGQPEYADQLIALEQRYGFISNQIKEIKEAYVVAEDVIDKLNEIENDLSSAKGWGTWDLFGGGMITGMIKHSHLDNAQNKVKRLDVLLQQLKNELSDVQRVDSIGNVNMEGFTRFADYFFDGFFVDWFVLSKISRSIDQIKEVKVQINYIMDELKNTNNKYSKEKEELRTKITDYIVNN